MSMAESETIFVEISDWVISIWWRHRKKEIQRNKNVEKAEAKKTDWTGKFSTIELLLMLIVVNTLFGC